MQQTIEKQEWSRYDQIARASYAEELLKHAFNDRGWKVDKIPNAPVPGADLIINRPDVSYVVEIKVAPEGRSDRLIPIWAQAYLQGKKHEPEKGLLVVVAAPRINPRAIEQLLDFAEQYAPDVAVGMIDFEGLEVFRGPYLDEGDLIKGAHLKNKREAVPKSINLFSDLNQWLLKVLLAPQIPSNLLVAPRSNYGNASELAKAANVSVMSAFRFIEQLKQDGYLDESSPQLKLVRVRDLLQKWLSAASAKSAKELPIKFLLRMDPKQELKRILNSGKRCLGLFAAAEVLGMGFVQGVPPHIYINRIDQAELERIGNVREANKNESPDVILREAKDMNSIFRARVLVDELYASDVLQIWLDVSFHPSRGAEQAKFIEDRIKRYINIYD